MRPFVRWVLVFEICVVWIVGSRRARLGACSPPRRRIELASSALASQSSGTEGAPPVALGAGLGWVGWVELAGLGWNGMGWVGLDSVALASSHGSQLSVSLVARLARVLVGLASRRGRLGWTLNEEAKGSKFCFRFSDWVGNLNFS